MVELRDVCKLYRNYDFFTQYLPEEELIEILAKKKSCIAEYRKTSGLHPYIPEGAIVVEKDDIPSYVHESYASMCRTFKSCSPYIYYIIANELEQGLYVDGGVIRACIRHIYGQDVPKLKIYSTDMSSEKNALCFLELGDDATEEQKKLTDNLYVPIECLLNGDVEGILNEHCFYFENFRAKQMSRDEIYFYLNKTFENEQVRAFLEMVASNPRNAEKKTA
jgi:hypothetical protein